MNLFELFVKLGIDDSEFNRGLDDASSKVSSIAKGMGAAFAAVTAAAAAGITAFAGASVKAGETFDKSMSQVAATMGKTVDEIQELRDYAQKMGSETAFSASQAADALNYMALAGYDAETSMEMLPNVLNLAAAGGMELATASDMVTDAQSALGLTLDETRELVDKMAVTSSKANTSVAQMGDAILTVGGTAKNLAGGVTELSQALGILADNGIKGAEGGTALRNIILALSSPTNEAAKELKSLGIEVYDAEGKMRALPDIFDDLNKSMENMTQGEQTEVLSNIFNKVDLKSANALLATSADRWDELANAIDNANGAAQQMADTQLDNLAGDITLFQSALEGAQIAISDKLTPTLREFVQFGSESLSNLTTAFKEDGLDGIIDAFGDAISNGIALINDKLPLVIDAGTKILGAVADGILENLPAIADAGIEIIFNLIDSLIDALPNVLPKLIDITSKIGETIVSHVDDIIEAGVKLVNVLLDSLLDQLPTIIEKSLTLIGMIVGEIFSAIKKSEKELSKNGETILDKVVKGLIDAISNVDWKKITDDISDAWMKNGGIDEGTQNAGLFDVGVAIFNHVKDGILNYTLIGQTAQLLVKSFEDSVNDALEHGGGGTGGHRGGGGHRGEKPEEGGHFDTSAITDYVQKTKDKVNETKKNVEALTGAVGDTAGTLETELGDIDHLFAIHRMDEETYLNKKLDTLMKYQDKESEEWWAYYDDTIERINKIEDGKRKAQEQADKEAEQAAQKRDQNMRKSVEKRFQQLEDEMNAHGYSEEWLVKRERMYIETLDHNTELYEDYNSQLLKAERKIDDATNAEREKRIKENQSKFSDMVKSIKDRFKSLKDAYQKAVDDIKSKMKSFGETLTKSYTDMFSFETDEKTGKVTAVKTKDFLANATKELEKYYANIQSLRSRNVSDSLLNQLTSMSAEEGAAVAEYWASLSDEQLKNLDENWKKYEATGQKISESLYSDEMADAEKQYDEERNTLLGEIKQEIADNADAVTSAIASIFSGMTGNVQINVAGMPVIKKGINEMLATIKNSGGVIDV